MSPKLLIPLTTGALSTPNAPIVNSVDRTARLVRNTAIYIAAVIALTLFYFALFHFIPRNSDNASSTLAGYELFHGNPLLKGWFLASDNFVATDIPLLGAFWGLLGSAPVAMLTTAAFLWAVVTVLSGVAVVTMSRGKATWVALMAIATLVGMPLLVDGDNTPAEAPVHVSTLACTLAAFLIAHAYLNGWKSPVALLTLFIVIALGTFSDPLMIVSCSAPIIATCLLVTSQNSRKQRLIVIANVVMAILAAKAAAVGIEKAGGYVQYPLAERFTSLDLFGDRVRLTVNGLLDASGTNFFGRDFQIHTSSSVAYFFAAGPIVRILRLPLLLAAICAVGAATIAIWRRMVSPTGHNLETQQSLVYFCALGCVAVLSAAVFGDVMVEGTTRYIVPAFILAAIPAALRIANWRLGRVIVVVAFAGSLLATVGAIGSTFHKWQYGDADKLALVAWLQTHALSDGYGPYWSANIITGLTSNGVRVRPVIELNGKLTPFDWLSSKTWYSLPGNSERRFVLVSGQASDFGERTVVNTFGSPEQKGLVGGYIVYVYDAGKTNFAPVSIDAR
jgi:hypothetical protein